MNHFQNFKLLPPPPPRINGLTNCLLRLFTVCTILLFSCTKEESDGNGMIEIFAERMGNGSKMLLDGAHSSWVDGDSIRINSDKVVVERINDHAYIRYAAPLSVNRAVYPASLASGNLSSDNVTITFPAYYHYRTDGSGHQLLDLPMAARSEGDDPMQFKHLTGALYITVTNTAAVPLTLQSVTVQSNRYKLNGTKTINLNDLDNISPSTGANDACSVSLLFDTGYTLASNASLKVMIPIMPVGGNGNNIFTIIVRSTSAEQANFYLNSRKQPSGSDHALARNQLGYAPIEITATNEQIPLDQVGGKYVVRTPLEFSAMAHSITNGTVSNTSNFEILEDLDMSNFSITTINNSAYAGTINGNNHKIRNLTINSVNTGSNEYSCALFYRAVASLVVKDITFLGLTLRHRGNTSNTLKLGGIFAYYEKGSSPNATLNIDNCKITFDNIDIQGATGNIYYGGLLCEVDGKYAQVNISNCQITFTTISLNGSKIYWGGLIASTGASTTTISSSSLTGSINLTATNEVRIGGFIGNKASSNFVASDCSISGAITASSPSGYLGSLIGYYYSQENATLSNVESNISFSLNGTSIPSNIFGN